MIEPQEYSFIQYLAAKKSVDDRALNQFVWKSLMEALSMTSNAAPLQILEVGAGIGTMLERMLDWRMLIHANYTAIDALPENIAAARLRLEHWAEQHGFQIEQDPGGLVLQQGQRHIRVELEAIDLFDFINRERGHRTWNLLLAHAFLDLMNIPNTLLRLFSLASENGLFYFTLNFDGATIFEPGIDPSLDEQIEALYHRTMDERLTGGLPSGDSRAGRHLFALLKESGARILSAGASDWVVFPGPDGYLGDEAYFLHFILHTLHSALAGHPQLVPSRLEDWIAKRHAQVNRGELIYIAHQLDFAGRTPKHPPGPINFLKT